MSAVLQCPTVAMFKPFVEVDALPAYECVVPIRAGGPRPPLFYVHGAGGNVLSLRPLAMSLPDDQPFYGLQAKGLDGSEPFATVEETAAHYVAEIRRVQPEGPYYVAGGCYGGLVAYEMAQLLRAQGAEVGLLALVDSYNVAYGSMIPKPLMLYCNVRFVGQRARHHLRQVRELAPGSRREYLRERFRTLAGHRAQLVRLLRGRSRSHVFNELAAVSVDTGGEAQRFIDALNRVIVANTQAQRQYVPRPYPGDVAVFKAAVPSTEPYQEQYLGWGPLLQRDRATVCVFPGDHEMRDEQNIRVLAQQLDQQLRRTQSRHILDGLKAAG